MKLTHACSILLLVTISLSTAVHADESLRAGLAVVDITPPAGFRMSGYFHERLNTGTHDPLLAKALVLQQGEDGKASIALVVCDLIGMSAQVSSEARRLAGEKTGIPAENMAICATHSHTGPLYAGVMRDHLHERAIRETGADAAETVDYAQQLTQRIAQAIIEAAAAARPVQLEIGVATQEGLSFNRRFHMQDGSVVFNPGKMNPKIVRPAGPIDAAVGMLLLRGAGGERDGQALGLLSAFALHLDTVGGTEYSADFPYYLQEVLGRLHGGEFVSIFANGPCGDINHIDVAHDHPQKGNEESRRIGEELATTIRAHFKQLQPVLKPALAARSAVIDVPMKQYSPEQVAQAQAAIASIGDGNVAFLERVETYNRLAVHALGGRTLPMQVQAFRIGEELAIVTLPGEIFVELGLTIKEQSPFKTTLVIELANDAPGYVPTKKAFGEGSYETVNARIAPGGGEMLVDEALKLLRELKGSEK